MAKCWIYTVDGKRFTALTSAKKFAEDNGELAIFLSYNGNKEILYQYNLITKKLRRVQTVPQAKAKLKEKYTTEAKKVSIHDVIDALKEKFYGNNPASWGRNSKKQLLAWYKEHIIEDKDASIIIY